MTRRASIIVYCLVIATVLLGLQSWSIAVGRLEQHVVSAIEQRTGLVVTARERAEIALLPLPRISLSNAVFQQRDGLLAGTALRIRARIRLLPLLAGNLSFDRIDLIVPQIDVAVPSGEEGLGNWLAAPLSYLEKLKVQSRIVMTGGAIFMRAQGVIQTILRDVNLVLEGRDADEPLALSGSLSWRGVPTELSLLWPMAGANARLSLRASSPLLALQFDGMRSVLDEPIVNGKLAISTKSLTNLLGWFGEQPRLAAAIGELDLTADAQIKPSEASLSNTVARIDGDRLEGVIKLGDAGPRLSLSGTLAGTQLDLGRLLGRLDLWHADSPADRAAPLDFEGWTAHDVDLRISVDSARLRGARLDDVATYLLVKKGRFEAGLLRAGAYGGSAKGRILAQSAPGGVDIKLQAGLDRINLAKAASDFPDLPRVSGTGGLQVALDGLGHSPETIIASLSGKTGISLRQGELGGFAFAELIRRLERNPKLLLSDWRQGKTPFDSAVVNFGIANGIATVMESQMTGPTYRLGLSGTVSLPVRWFDMTASLSSANGNLQLPFSLRGPLANPAFEFDSGAFRSGDATTPVPTLLTR